MGSMGKGDWKKVQDLKFYADVTRLQASEGGVCSFLMSKHHQARHACVPNWRVDGPIQLVVFTSSARTRHV